MNKPFLVGITGGIGSGKSVICKVFIQLGVPVYDADSNAKRLMSVDADLIGEIKQQFGDESYQANGQLNREFLAAKVFNNEKALKQLNGLVHPRIGIDFKRWTALFPDALYLIKEAALLIESGSYKALDKLIVVKASRDIRIKRVLLRDAFRSKAEIELIMDKQLSDSEYVNHADFTINNNEENLILPSIIKLHEKIGLLAGQRSE